MSQMILVGVTMKVDPEAIYYFPHSGYPRLTNSLTYLRAFFICLTTLTC